MIQTLSIRNFKVLREVDVILQPLTVVVGPNASGKTSILQALAIISGWVNGSRDYTLSNQAQSRISEGPTRIGCQVKLEEQTSRFEVNLSSMDVTKNEVEWMKWGHAFLNLSTKKLAASSYPKSTSLTLPSDGEGLPSILAGLRLESQDKFTDIVSQLKDVVANLIDIRVRQIQIDLERVGHELLFDLKGATAVQASAISEGTLLTLGVLTALSTGGSPQIALIDDIERGLHPKALKSYMAQIRLLQKRDPELQIVATSHSPYLLDYLEADEVLLTSLDEEGYTVVKALADHPDYARSKAFMAPGEFWSAVGESWIVEDRKATA